MKLRNRRKIKIEKNWDHIIKKLAHTTKPRRKTNIPDNTINPIIEKLFTNHYALLKNQRINIVNKTLKEVFNDVQFVDLRNSCVKYKSDRGNVPINKLKKTKSFEKFKRKPLQFRRKRHLILKFIKSRKTINTLKF